MDAIDLDEGERRFLRAGLLELTLDPGDELSRVTADFGAALAS